MSKVNLLAKRSENGLLTPDNCVVATIDAQPQLLFGVSRFDRHAIFNNNAALARAARVFGVPIVLPSVETKGFSGSTWSQVLAALAALGNPTRSPVGLSASRARAIPALTRFKRFALLDRSARSRRAPLSARRHLMDSDPVWLGSPEARHRTGFVASLSVAQEPPSI